MSDVYDEDRGLQEEILEELQTIRGILSNMFSEQMRTNELLLRWLERRKRTMTRATPVSGGGPRSPSA